MKSIMMCLILCACSGSSEVEDVPYQASTNNPPKDNGRIENPTNNGAGGCSQSHAIMIDGQLVFIPTACNEGVHLDRGDPLVDRGDPAEKKTFIKYQSK